MTAPLKSRLQVFDPRQDYAVVERRLPHWSQAGTIALITWRTWDSIPAAVLKQWLSEQDAWLSTHVAPQGSECSHLAPQDASSRGTRGLHLHDPATRLEFQLYVSDRWNDHLDACHGACVLRRPEHSQIVADSLLHFDGDRYELTDFVVMPNHVHVLVAFPDEDSMLRQCDAWKHFTATKINCELGRPGRFWQQDDFDHLVRSLEQYEYLRSYIADNPRRAKLRPGEYRHFSKA